MRWSSEMSAGGALRSTDRIGRRKADWLMQTLTEHEKAN